ncbi:MAG: UxaA family hydrolase [Candidatus Freyarchaeota archaeon]|nr:UxaA family hydrolase [Candidatus Jordarchaeia archaeon]
MARFVVMSEKDNVATAVSDIPSGTRITVMVDGREVEVEVKSDIQFGHKFALKDIGVGEPVVKYGEVIGVASKPIKAGEHVHVHNVVSTFVWKAMGGGGR